MSAIAERYHKLKTCPVFYGGCINTICARGGGPLRGQVFPCPARARARARPPRSIMRPAPTPGRARPRPPNQFTAPLEKCRGEYKRAPCPSPNCPALNRARIPLAPLAPLCPRQNRIALARLPHTITAHGFTMRQGATSLQQWPIALFIQCPRQRPKSC